MLTINPIRSTLYLSGCGRLSIDGQPYGQPYDHHMIKYLDVGDQWIPIPGQGHNSQPYKLSGHGHPYNLDGQPYDLLDWCG